MTTKLVQGSDPSLRDRRGERLIDVLLTASTVVALDDDTIGRGAAAARARPTKSATKTTSRRPARGSSCRSSPWSGTRRRSAVDYGVRVVVVREIGNLTAEQGQWLRSGIAAPLDACTCARDRRGPDPDRGSRRRGRRSQRRRRDRRATAAASRRRPRMRGCGFTPEASTRITTHLGDDAAACRARGAPPRDLRRQGALDVDAVEGYLGEPGTGVAST